MRELTDEHILEEIGKIKYTYGLNKVIRYNFEREEKYHTQSVAEHITNMIFLAHYFKEHEDPNNTLDFEKVIKLIMMHDMGEIETGDIISVVKNIEDDNVEREAIQKVKEKSPHFISKHIEEYFEEYENPKTPEGKFVKAIDKMEGQIFWVEQEGVEMCDFVLTEAGLDINEEQPKVYEKIFNLFDEYGFTIMKRYLEVINRQKESYGIIRKSN